MLDATRLVTCHTLHGASKQIPAERLTQRASVYGLIVHQGALLLARGIHTGRYVLPGGGIEPGERIEAALKREVREETGLDVRVDQFLGFHEDFFYYDPLDAAFHGFLFYYRCTPLTFTLAVDGEVDDEDVAQPCWVPLSELTAESFQTHGETTLRLIQDLHVEFSEF